MIIFGGELRACQWAKSRRSAKNPQFFYLALALFLRQIRIERRKAKKGRLATQQHLSLRIAPQTQSEFAEAKYMFSGGKGTVKGLESRQAAECARFWAGEDVPGHQTVGKL